MENSNSNDVITNNTASEITNINTKTYGFIILRHVNSEKTNRYWNRCVKLIRSFYPYRDIVIIDDNSNAEFLKADCDYKNVTTIQSEYVGRGELLPYIYYAKYNWFDKAVIIHDSVFFHRRIEFEKMNAPFLSLWHFDKAHNKTHLTNNLRIADALNYSDVIKKMLNSNSKWTGCFGVQTFIKRTFLIYIMNKYNIENLIHNVTCREDRCSLERIFGVIFYLELRRQKKSLFGDMTKGNKFGHTYDEYIYNLKTKKSINAKVVKCFTGR